MYIELNTNLSEKMHHIRDKTNIASNCLQRYVLYLENFDYKIGLRKSSKTQTSMSFRRYTAKSNAVEKSIYCPL